MARAAIDDPQLEERTISSGGNIVGGPNGSSCRIRLSSTRPAVRAICTTGLITVVSGGSVTSATAPLSNTVPVSDNKATSREEGKPEQAIARITEGRLNGFFKDVVLLEQPSVTDTKKSVKAVLEEAGVTVKRFARFEVGA